MNRINMLAPAMTLMALAIAAAPALAQDSPHARQGDRARGEGEVRGRAVPRVEDNRREDTRRGDDRRFEGPRGDNRPGDERRSREWGGERFVAPRQYVRPYYNRPEYRTYSYRNYRPYYRSYYRSYYRPFSRPYYTFRPRWNLGFGLWVGYPVAYPYYYATPAYPNYYGTPSYPETYPSPNQTAVGGLTFDIQPDDAEVFVDGMDMGPVSDFSSTNQPLSLVPGRHRIELRSRGYFDTSFDADIVAGEVIPYQGTMERR